MHNFYEKLRNLRTKIRILRNFKDKIHIYSVINMVNCGKQLMAHALGIFMYHHEL